MFLFFQVEIAEVFGEPDFKNFNRGAGDFPRAETAFNREHNRRGPVCRWVAGFVLRETK